MILLLSLCYFIVGFGVANILRIRRGIRILKHMQAALDELKTQEPSLEKHAALSSLLSGMEVLDQMMKTFVY